MTLDEIKKSDKAFLTPSDIAPLLGCNHYLITLQAKEDITKLGFHASLVGTRLRIPRVAFLNWYTGTTTAC